MSAPLSSKIREVYHVVVERFLQTPIGGWANLHILNPIDTRLLRLTRGRFNTALGTRLGPNVALLECAGAKSNMLRRIPVLATPWEGGWVLIASATGRERHPAWYHNLKAHPTCTLVTACGPVACLAHEADDAERLNAWAAANERYSGFTVYQERTSRRLPVVILHPQV
jgi:deazaflavin-dependent oxidoreductase (nitroreductase family)